MEFKPALEWAIDFLERCESEAKMICDAKREDSGDLKISAVIKALRERGSHED